MARFIYMSCALIGLTFFQTVLLANGVDLNFTDIHIVSDKNRYQALNPNAILDAFGKIRHVKGNMYFSKGKRINGDHLLVNFLDRDSFTESENVQVVLRYPAKGPGPTITFAEVLVDLTSEEADTFFVDGGIGEHFAEFLIECNSTISFTYELFIYGF